MDNIYSVYVIQSKVDNRLYVGMTADIDNRLAAHNNKQVFSTKGYAPWALVYLEKVGKRIEARKREKYLKSGCGKEFIKSYIPR